MMIAKNIDNEVTILMVVDEFWHLLTIEKDWQEKLFGILCILEHCCHLPALPPSWNRRVQTVWETTVLASPRAACIVDKLQIASPNQNLVLWILVNTICCASSVAVLVDIILAQEHLSKRPTARVAYLMWDFATTVIWLVEAALIVVDRLPRPLTYEHMIELFLAIYYLFDSIQLLQTWKLKHQDFDEELLDVTLNAAIYLYMILQLLHVYRRRYSFTELKASFDDDYDDDSEEDKDKDEEKAAGTFETLHNNAVLEIPEVSTPSILSPVTTKSYQNSS